MNLKFFYKKNNSIIVSLDNEEIEKFNNNIRNIIYLQRPDYFITNSIEPNSYRTALKLIDQQNKKIHNVVVCDQIIGIDFLKNLTNSIVYLKDNKYYHKNLETQRLTEIDNCIYKYLQSQIVQIMVGDKYLFIETFQYLGSIIYNIQNKKIVFSSDLRVVVSKDFLNGKTGFFYQVNKNNNQYTLFFNSEKVLSFVRPIFLTVSFPVKFEPININHKYFSVAKKNNTIFYQLNHETGEIKEVNKYRFNNENKWNTTFLSENDFFMVNEYENSFLAKSAYILNIKTNELKCLYDLQQNSGKLSMLELLFKSLELYRQNKKIYHLYVNDNCITLSPDSNLKIIDCLDTKEDIYISTIENEEFFLIKVKEHGQFEVLTDKYKKPYFYLTQHNPNICIIICQNQIIIQDIKNKRKLKLINNKIEDKPIVKSYLLSDNLLYVNIKDHSTDKSFIVNIKIFQIHTPITDSKQFIVEPCINKIWDFFIHSKIVYDKKGKKIGNLLLDDKDIETIKNTYKKPTKIVTVDLNTVCPYEWITYREKIEKCIKISQLLQNKNTLTQKTTNKLSL